MYLVTCNLVSYVCDVVMMNKKEKRGRDEKRETRNEKQRMGNRREKKGNRGKEREMEEEKRIRGGRNRN